MPQEIVNYATLPPRDALTGFIVCLAGFLILAKNAAIMIVSFVALTGAFSVARQAALGGPFQYGLTYDNGTRVMFIGNYYGASIYQKAFHPGEDFVFVRPENGPASRELFAVVRNHLAKSDVKDLGLSDSNNIDEALQNLIANPSNGNAYVFWWSLDPPESGRGRPIAAQSAARDSSLSTSNPTVLWNFSTFLFEPPMVPREIV